MTDDTIRELLRTWYQAWCRAWCQTTEDDCLEVADDLAMATEAILAWCEQEFGNQGDL